MKLLLSLLFISSAASAGVYDDTVARGEAYRSSPEYLQRVQAEQSARVQGYNSKSVRNAEGVARLHKGLASTLQITYNSIGAVQNIQFSCRDGNDCKCSQYGKLSCECVNRVTFNTKYEMYDDWYLHGSKKRRK